MTLAPQKENDMNEILEIIKDWPIIVQGALGSALFWGLLTSGSFLVRKWFELTVKLSKKTRLDYLRKQRNFYDAMINLKRYESIDQALASRYRLELAIILASQVQVFFILLVKALILVLVGFLIIKHVSPIGVIGHFGGVLYLFLSINAISLISFKGFNLEAGIEELDQERRNIIKKLVITEKAS